MLTFDFGRAPVGSGDVVVDLGCGEGRHSYEALRRGATVLSLDLSEELLADVGLVAHAMQEEHETPAGAAWAGIVGDALALPFASDSVDVVIACEVLEHIPRDSAAMAEIARVLRPGGRLVVSVPRWWPERVCWALSTRYHSNDGGHVRIYRRATLVHKLEQAGFVARARHYAHALHSPYWWLKCMFGVDRKNALLPRLYHRFLVWDLTSRPRTTRVLESVLNPVLGKSLVLYLENRKETLDRAA